MKLVSDAKKELQEEYLWVPKTPAKLVGVRSECEDFSAVGADHGLNQCQDSGNFLSAVNEEGNSNDNDKAQSDVKAEPSIKSAASTSISTPLKTENARPRNKETTYRPKVVVEGGKMYKTREIKTPKSPTKECGDGKSVDLTAEYTSKLCRQALSFNFSFENDGRELKKDAKDSCATWQRGCCSFPLKVYRRREFKVNQCLQNSRNSESDANDSCITSPLKVYRRVFKVNQCLQNSRKSGPNFPKVLKKKRMRRLRANGREKWWKEEREIFRGRVDSFIAHMYQIQGDRRFSPWKGSVVDSVVGAFLSQNVSDHLSSSAFMSLAAKYPVQSTTTGRTTTRTERVSVLRAKTPFRTKKNKNQLNAIDRDDLRKAQLSNFPGRETTNYNMDSVNWEEVRKATTDEVAKAIKIRGQHRVLAKRIKDFLDRLLREHKGINLEWLRDIPPEKAKDYLLSFYGLGLKSVECVLLLTLHHHAFPVDTNVGRVVVRLGWVPPQPLPDWIQSRRLKKYPLRDKVQEYLWPRLCTLDQTTLYELHYQMITFGKVFCRKRKPNCAACPMRGECRHFANTSASARVALPEPDEKSTMSAIVSISAVEGSAIVNTTAIESLPEAQALLSESRYQIENVDPIVEHPPSPVPESTENLVRDIEDWYGQTEDEDDIPTIRLNTEEFKERMWEFMNKSYISLPEDDMSQALVTLTSRVASMPLPKLKDASQLKTVHRVYILPDSHPVLEGVEERVPDDPCPYLLAVWASDDDPDPVSSYEPLGKQGDSQNFRTVLGTILIPCRTAMRGRFPLNGTYFQVNEVFADDESSHQPLKVPGVWLWKLLRRTLYCGTSTSVMLSGLSTSEIKVCFWTGFVCVRSFNRKTRAPGVLSKKFHAPPSTTVRGKRKYTRDEDKDEDK